MSAPAGGRTQGAQRPRVVVGVDGSAGSREALAWALPVAAARGATVEVLAVFPVDFYWTDVYLVDRRRADAVRADTEARARAMVAAVRSDPALAVAGSTPVDVLVLPGAPAEQLIGQGRGADLLVLGSRGRSGVRSTLLGSVALHCSAHAHCPVVVVHPARSQPSSPVVVGFDDTPAGRAAVHQAVDEATRLGADVEVVTVVGPMELWSDLSATPAEARARTRQHAEQRARQVVSEVLGDRVGGDQPAVRVEAVEGSVTEVLVREAARARLLVVGSRSRSRLVGMMLGSVALHCVVHAPCPVLVVHAEPGDQPDQARAQAGSEAAGMQTARS